MQRLSTLTDTPRAFVIIGTGELVFKADGKVHRRVITSRQVTNYALQWVRYRNADVMVDEGLELTSGNAVADAWFARSDCPSLLA